MKASLLHKSIFTGRPWSPEDVWPSAGEVHTRSTAAASIGQVHRAETLDGSQIAVKVQYLGLADIQKVLSLVSMMKMLWLILDMTQTL